MLLCPFCGSVHYVLCAVRLYANRLGLGSVRLRHRCPSITLLSHLFCPVLVLPVSSCSCLLPLRLCAPMPCAPNVLHPCALRHCCAAPFICCAPTVLCPCTLRPFCAVPLCAPTTATPLCCAPVRLGTRFKASREGKINANHNKALPAEPVAPLISHPAPAPTPPTCSADN